MPASGRPRALVRLEAELAALLGAPVELERPTKAEHGDLATSAPLRAAHGKRRPPRQVAEELAARAQALPQVARAEVAGPGFVNLWLAPDWFGEALAEILEAG
ncbi:MAG: arginine--tRNA ligase, partial [Thermoleophilia bacterium]